MKRYLLIVMLCVFVSLGMWAYQGTWYNQGGTWNNTGNGDILKLLHGDDGLQLIESGKEGLIASWTTFKQGTNEVTEFSYLENTSSRSKIKITGKINADDIKALTGSETLNPKIKYFDLSEAEIVGDIDWTAIGFNNENQKTLILPNSVSTADVAALQRAYFECIAYFDDAAHKHLNVYCEKETITTLKSLVTTDMAIALMPKYNVDGTIPETGGYLTPNTQNTDKDFITHLGELNVASIDMKWMNGSDMTYMKDQMVNLSNDTHYLVIPSNNPSTYNAEWDPVNYTYNSNVWAVSTYFGTAQPYSMHGDFGGRQYSCGFYSSQTSPFSPDESAQTANYTQILQTGHLSDIFSYMSSDQKNAGVSAFYGEITSADMASITAANCASKYIDFSRASFNGTTIAALPNTVVNYIELPYGTDISTLSVGDFKSNVKEAVAVDAANGNMYAYSSASSLGTLEHILAYDTKWKEVTGEVYNVHNTLKLEGTYNDVFGTAYKYANSNQNLKPTILDLSGASFPSFTSDIFKYNSYLTDTNTKNGAGKELYSYDTTTYSVSSSNKSATCSVNSTFESEANGLANLWSMNTTLTSVSLPTDANTTTLPSMAFYNCSLITGELTVPANYKTIGAAVFGGCAGITTLNISAVTLMGIAACANMAGLSTVNLPNTLTRVPDFCFTVCPSLETIDLPEGLEVIGVGAFKANSGTTTQIHSIRFPSTLKRIECEAFVENHYLTVLSFPAGLEYIGTAAFTNSQHITDVYFLGTTPPVVEPSAFDSRTTGQSQGRANSTYEIDCDGKKSVSRYYYNGNADASTVTGFADDRAILHYPIVKTEAEYAATSINIFDYNAANAAEAAELYYKVGEEYVKLTGAPVSGTTYYTKSGSESEEFSSTTASVANVSTYYSAESEESVAVPLVANDTYYYENGTNPVYSDGIWEPQIYNGNLVTTYYKENKGEYTESPMGFSNVKYYNPISEERDKYISTSNVVVGKTLYTTNDGTDTEAFPEFVTTLYGNPIKIYGVLNGEYTEVTAYSPTYEDYKVRFSYDGGTNYNDYDPNVNASALTFKDNTNYYYKDGTETVTTYSSTNVWIPEVTTYYSDENGTVYYNGTIGTDSWPGGAFDGYYYYVSGSTPKYDSANGQAWNAHTYYTNSDGTAEATTISFDGTYYYHPTTVSYSDVDADAEILKTATLQNTVLYSDQNGTVATAPLADGTYYELVTPASNDLYGDLYTVPERNSKWAENDGKVALNGNNTAAPECGDYYYDELAYWPPGYWQDVDQTYGDSPYAGVKQFLLVAGYHVENEETPTPVQTIDHITKDVWYTVCFPFDLSEVQLKTTFGPNFELAEFSGVEPKDDDSGIILMFTRNPQPMELHAHKAYMIHPASGKIEYQVDGEGNPLTDEDGNKMAVIKNGKTVPAETSFTLVGIEETQADHDYTTAQLFAYNADDYKGNNAILTRGKLPTDDALSYDEAYKTGNYFLFTGISHSNYYDFEKKTGKRVLLPQYCYFLGTKAGEDFPRYFRQASADVADRETGLWRKNVAVVIPPASTFVAPEAKISSGTNANGEWETWKSGFTCTKYVYEPKGDGEAKVLSAFDLMIVDDYVRPETNIGNQGIATAIKEVGANNESPVSKKRKGVYNLSGQYVAKTVVGLAPGVYVVNGEKYLVK